MLLRILTLNVWALPWPVSSRVPERMRAIGEALPALGADVVALQEVWLADSQKVLLEAGRRAGYAHTWRPPGFAPTGSGLLLLSRWPLRDVALERYVLRGRPERVQDADWYGHKGFVRAELDTPEGAVALVNTHVHARYRRREADEYLGLRVGQVVQLAAAVARVEGPVVAVGDFNLEEGHPEYSVLRGLSGLRDTAAELDARRETSASGRRLDYVFVRDGGQRALRPLRVERVLDRDIEVDGIRTRPSDHAGLLAELELRPAADTSSVRRTIPDPAAVDLATRLLAEGRAAADRRRRERRRWASAAAAGAVVAGAGTRLPSVTRRRWLRNALAVGAAACVPAGLGLLALSEAADADELEAYDRVGALLPSAH